MELFFHQNPNGAGPVIRGGEVASQGSGYWSLRRKLPSGIDQSSVERWFDAFVNQHPVPSDLARRWAATKMGFTVTRISDRALLKWSETRLHLVSAEFQPLLPQVTLERLFTENKVYRFGTRFSVSDTMDIDQVRNEQLLSMETAEVLRTSEGNTRFWLDLSDEDPVVLPAQIRIKPDSGRGQVWNF